MLQSWLWPLHQVVLTEQLLESMKQDDAISAFFHQLSERYPELPPPLIHERGVTVHVTADMRRILCLVFITWFSLVLLV
jgi:pheromone shutdown protein TraB